MSVNMETGQPVTSFLIVSYIPFGQNKNFTGRESQIQKLWEMLFEEEKKRVALVGLGGMGKSQIALELAHRVKLTLKQYSVLYMPAQSMPAFQKAATELVQKLAIPCDDNDDPKAVLQSYLASETAGHWLLILDNADDILVLNGLQGFTGLLDVPPQSPTGRILITTRSSKVAVDAAGSDVLELTEMALDEATAFLSKAIIDKSQLKQINIVAELLDKLAYIPLTVAQAAAYMNMNKMPILNYLLLFGRTDQDAANLLGIQLRDETYHSKTQGAIATTWIISFNSICEVDRFAAQLLSFIRWIEPKAIPQTMLPRSTNDWDVTRAIGLLCGYSFLSWREDGKTLDMHRLVHLSLKQWLGQSSNNFMTQQDVIQHLTNIFPSDDWEGRFLWRQYLPHVLPLVLPRRLGKHPETLNLGYCVGRCLMQDGRTIEAVEVLQSVVETRETLLAEDDPCQLASQHALSMAYQENGQVKQAIELLEHVVSIRERLLAEDHPFQLASKHELARAYQANGQVEKAIQLLKHVVSIQGRLFENDHPDQLTSQHQLASAYRANGQVMKAIELLEPVVAIQETSLPEDHPDRLTSQHLLAMAYMDNGHVEQAIELLEVVVTIQKTSLPEDHPDLLASQQVLTMAYEMMATSSRH